MIKGMGLDSFVVKQGREREVVRGRERGRSHMALSLLQYDV